MSFVTEVVRRRTRGLTLSERREIERRKILMGALAAPVVIAGQSLVGVTPAEGSSSNLGSAASPSPTPALLPHYVYGIVQDVSSDTVTLIAPTADGSEIVTVAASSTTKLVFPSLNPSLADVPVGSRLEALTTLVNGDLTSRQAKWMMLNPVRSHGQIMGPVTDTSQIPANASGLTALQLQSAHSGPSRNLYIADQSPMWDGTDTTSSVDATTFNTGCYVFFEGIAASEDPTEPNIYVTGIVRVAVSGPST
jgi:hypothetical protein